MEYKIIETEDMSSVAKRISAKIIVDADRDNKEMIKKLMLDLVQVLKVKKIEKGRTLARHGSKPFEVVYIYLYKSIDEMNHGLPLARTSFIDPECKMKPRHFSNDFIDDNTAIAFDKSYEALGNMIRENKVSDEEFLEKITDQFEALLDIYKSTKIYLDDHNLLSEEYKKHESILRDMSDKFVGFPNDKYTDINEKFQSLLASLSNIGVVANNDKYDNIQKRNLINLHFNSASEDVDYLLTELA